MNNFLQYFTTRFAQLLMHCYNTVEKLSMEKEFGEHFYDNGSGGSPDRNSGGNAGGNSGGNPEGNLSGSPGGNPGGNSGGSSGSSGKSTVNSGGNNSSNPAGNQVVTIKTLEDLTRSEYFTFCDQYTTFTEHKVEIDTIVLKNISHTFVEGKKTFLIFLQRNGANITQLKFSHGSLKFESLNEILQKLPNLRKIVFDEIKYQVLETKQIFDQATCQNLVELDISENTEKAAAKLIQEAFQNYNNINTTIIGRNTPVPSLEVSKLLTEEKMVTTPLVVEASSSGKGLNPSIFD